MRKTVVLLDFGVLDELDESSKTRNPTTEQSQISSNEPNFNVRTPTQRLGKGQA